MDNPILIIIVGIGTSLGATIIGGIAGWFFNYKRKSDKTANDIGGLNNDIGGLKNDIGGLKNDISNVSKKMTNGFDEVNISIGKINLDKEILTNEFSKLTSDHKNLIKEVDERTNRFEMNIVSSFHNILSEQKDNLRNASDTEGAPF